MRGGRELISGNNLLCVILSLSFIFTSVSSIIAATIDIPEKIRVVVADDADELDLSIKGPYEIRTLETGELLEEGKTFFGIKIKPTSYGIDFGKKKFKIYGIHIIPRREPAIYFGKCLYRGSFQIIKTKDGLLCAINVVDLEDYIRGVLFHEVSQSWPIEAIKAQAIASRTFALYQAQQNKDQDYYLKSDVSSQMYRGVYAEKYRTNKAVEETVGEILIWDNRILPAFFHATCGGHTEDASRLWNVSAAPLNGIRCAYCKNSPHFVWELNLSLFAIEKKLNEAGYNISGISSIDIEGRDLSGRVTQIILTGKEQKVIVSAKDLRSILGPRYVRSTNFTVKIIGENVYLEGKGWGHGVGLCQWGAFSLAKKGKDAQQILSFYYPGSVIANITDK